VKTSPLAVGLFAIALFGVVASSTSARAQSWKEGSGPVPNAVPPELVGVDVLTAPSACDSCWMNESTAGLVARTIW
jgi:hypothetical protein